jgi:hypothetical protein
VCEILRVLFVVIASLTVLFLILQENGFVRGIVAMCVTSVPLGDVAFAPIHSVLSMPMETSGYIQQLAWSARSMKK